VGDYLVDMRFHILIAFWAIHAWAQLPKPIQGGYDLPNGWKITPAGRAIVALHSGFNPHGLGTLVDRTVGLVESPYVKRKALDSTLYTTSSMLRSVELPLGLPPMSQYDAAASPMYASFAAEPDLTPYNAVPAQVDLNEKNTTKSYGSRASAKMDFDGDDHAPMHLLNEIIWKSVKGAESAMPPPVHRYRPLRGLDE
jgi:hypothetical protein